MAWLAQPHHFTQNHARGGISDLLPLLVSMEHMQAERCHSPVFGPMWAEMAEMAEMAEVIQMVEMAKMGEMAESLDWATKWPRPRWIVS